jgi:hypothetical protein
MADPDCEEQENEKKDEEPSLVPLWVIVGFASDKHRMKQTKG